MNQKRSADLYRYARCGSCGLVFLLDVPSDLGHFYPADYYTLPSKDRMRKAAHRTSYEIGFILRHVSSGRLTEVGPALGTFAWLARSSGFDVTGIEMDARCCEHLRDVVGVNAVNSAQPEAIFPTLPPSDAIAMWHVLEHLVDPFETLTAAAANLKSGGALLIATPNPEALGFRLMGSSWPHLDAPRHLHLFPLEALVERCRTLGLGLAEASFDDPGARSWNRFSWQRLMLNRVHRRPARMAALLLGGALAAATNPLDRRAHNSSAYTAVFVKDGP